MIRDNTGKTNLTVTTVNSKTQRPFVKSFKSKQMYLYSVALKVYFCENNTQVSKTGLLCAAVSVIACRYFF